MLHTNGAGIDEMLISVVDPTAYETQLQNIFFPGWDVGSVEILLER